MFGVVCTVRIVVSESLRVWGVKVAVVKGGKFTIWIDISPSKPSILVKVIV